MSQNQPLYAGHEWAPHDVDANDAVPGGGGGGLPMSVERPANSILSGNSQKRQVSIANGPAEGSFNFVGWCGPRDVHGGASRVVPGHSPGVRIDRMRDRGQASFIVYMFEKTKKCREQ